MIRVQLHTQSILYGTISWKYGNAWNVQLSDDAPVENAVNDLHAWFLSTKAESLHVNSRSPNMEKIVALLCEQGYTHRPEDGVPSVGIIVERSK